MIYRWLFHFTTAGR